MLAQEKWRVEVREEELDGSNILEIPVTYVFVVQFPFQADEFDGLVGRELIEVLKCRPFEVNLTRLCFAERTQLSKSFCRGIQVQYVRFKSLEKLEVLLLLLLKKLE
jgi:hypothetical protein